MPDIVFGVGNNVTYPTKYHGEVTLSKRKWDEICAEPERFYYRHNGEKVPTTLIAPDLVRHSTCKDTQLIYYKQFEKFKISEGVEAQFAVKLMAVIIDTATQRICTVYPTNKPKSGTKEYKPEGS